MEPDLAAQLPEVKTYRGQGIDDPAATARLDWTPAGFHAIVLSSAGAVYIDPNSRGDVRNYRAYFQRDYRRTDGESFRCGLTNEEVRPRPDAGRGQIIQQPAHGTQLRTYRLALAATGEYTAVFGGTKAAAQTVMITTVNRVNAIYERDFAVRMNLINNTNIIYTSGSTDPYTNTNGARMMCENEKTVDAAIGPANYDIGHVFSTGGGGVAGLGVVCDNTIDIYLGCSTGLNGSIKAAGVTGSSNPTGDAFDVDYVAHEMGHQFGGPHTFNGTIGACGGGNRNASTAYEPGSGSTIQAYAGICGVENLQAHSDPYFHASSQTSILAYITNTAPDYGGACPVTTATGNSPPTVSAGANFTIPRSTPFTLTATGADANGDSLTYTWEQMNLGGSTNSNPYTDDGTRPLFRSFNPSSSSERTFPRLSSLLTNTNPYGELLPTTTRALNFRVTARDNRSGGGGTASADMLINVIGAAGPFALISPNTAVSLNGNSAQTITWSVAGTTAAPINTANVNLLLSTDSGNSFWRVLAANTPNDGTQVVTLPNISVAGTARVKVAATNSVYFDFSDANFSIARQSTCAFATGDVDLDGIPDNIELGEFVDPCTKDNDIFASPRLFGMQQYRDFLKREGDGGGITYWTNAITAGVSRATVVKSFFDSPEFQGTIAPVTRLYFAYFNRIPDKPGLDYWIYQYRAGMSLNTISQAFAGSPEFIGTYGSLNNSQFVTLVYNNVLGRAPDAFGLSYWTAQLDGGFATRGQVMVGFSESPEYQQTSYNRVFVTMTYYGMLVRMPDQAGFNYWVALLGAGSSPLDIINGFLGASEYRGRFLP